MTDSLQAGSSASRLHFESCHEPNRGLISSAKKRRLTPHLCLPFTDLASNQFIDGMRKIFELEPFIKIHSISTNNKEEKFIQNAAVASL
jgi:hypothetical protein